MESTPFRHRPDVYSVCDPFAGKAVRHLRLLLEALAAVTIAGCHSSDSSDGGDVAPEPSSDSSDDGAPASWNPSDVYFHVDVEVADDVTAKIRADLRTLGPGPRFTIYHLLAPGDVLSACAGAVCKSLTRGPDQFSHPSYVADLPYVGETPYTISLARRGEVVAPNTVITLPVPFTILAPPAGLSVTDGQQVTVQWSPPNNGDRANVPFDTNGSSSVHSDMRCYHDGGAQSERRHAVAFQRVDTGTATVRIDELFEEGYVVGIAPLPQAPVLRCDIVLQVTQARNGTIDGAFKHGSFTAALRQSVTINYTPSQR